MGYNKTDWRPAVSTRPRRVKAAQKRRMALDLRSAGLTFPAIAEEMTRQGFQTTPGSVANMVRKSLLALSEQDAIALEELRALDLYRIDQALQVLWPQVRAGNLKAMREYRAFIDQRARLLGTYSAHKVEASVTVNHTIDQEDRAEIARLEEAFLTAGQPKELEKESIADAELVDEPEVPDVSPFDVPENVETP